MPATDSTVAIITHETRAERGNRTLDRRPGADPGCSRVHEHALASLSIYINKVRQSNLSAE
jgi:hypothetical protein